MKWKRAKEEYDSKMSEVSRELSFSDDDDDEDIPRVYLTSSDDKNEEGEKNATTTDKNKVLKVKIVRSYDSSEDEEDVKNYSSDEKGDGDSSSAVIHHKERDEVDEKLVEMTNGCICCTLISKQPALI